MTATSGNLDTYLALSSVDAETVYASNDDAAFGDTNSRLETRLTVSDNLAILASRYNLADGTTTGSFTLTLELVAPLLPTALPANPTKPPIIGGSDAGSDPGVGQQASANLDVPEDCGEGLDFMTPLQVNYVQTGEITDDDTFAAYCLYARAGDELTIEATATSGNLDTIVLLTTPQLEDLGSNDDIGNGNRNSRLEFTVEKDGLYIVSVSRFSGEDGTSTGEFDLLVSRPYTCDEAPWSYLVADRWISTDDDGNVELAFDFSCDGKVEVELQGEVTSVSYVFEGNTITLGSGLAFEDVFVLETVMLASLNDSLFLLVTESALEDD